MKTGEAIVAVMRDVRAVGKNDRNTNQNFMFRGIDAVLNAAGPAMREHGLYARPYVLETTYRQIEGRNNSRLNHWTARVLYEFRTDDDPDVEAVAVEGEAMDAGDKGLSKAMSVAYRIALIQLLALPTGEADPDHDTYEMGEPDPPPTEKVESRLVNEARKAILRELTSRRPPWTLEQIETDFKVRQGGDIREADLNALQAYLAAVKQ